MNENGRIRKRISYTSISTYAILDNNLSAQAKGVYSIIVALLEIANKDPNYTVYKNTVLSYMTNGSRSFNTAWKELKDLGYLKQYRIRVAEGFIYEYELLDEPDTSTPGTINVKFDGSVSEQPRRKIDLDIEFEEKQNEDNAPSELNAETEPTYQGHTREEFTEIINNQIDYHSIKQDEILISHKLYDTIIDDIRNVIVDTYFSNSEYKIHNTKYPTNSIRSVFSNLNRWHIETAANNIKQYIDDGNTIKNAHAFIITTLYDTYLTNGTKTYQDYG